MALYFDVAEFLSKEEVESAHLNALTPERDSGYSKPPPINSASLFYAQPTQHRRHLLYNEATDAISIEVWSHSAMANTLVIMDSSNHPSSPIITRVQCQNLIINDTYIQKEPNGSFTKKKVESWMIKENYHGNEDPYKIINNIQTIETKFDLDQLNYHQRYISSYSGQDYKFEVKRVIYIHRKDGENGILYNICVAPVDEISLKDAARFAASKREFLKMAKQLQISMEHHHSQYEAFTIINEYLICCKSKSVLEFSPYAAMLFHKDSPQEMTIFKAHQEKNKEEFDAMVKRLLTMFP